MTNQIVLGHITEGPHRGERFCIPLQHTVFTGMTGISGKTTGEEAIFSRLPATDPPYRVLVFLTKRGEKVFHDAHNIKPFYKPRFDWEYLEGLLAASMREKLKFERAWIIKLAKLTQTEMAQRQVLPEAGLFLARQILGSMLQEKRMRDIDRNVYTVLAAYMDKVLPTIKASMADWSRELQLQPGVNVMDLTPWYTNEEVQMLVIRSCMEHILQKESNVIVALPECWKMLPQTRNTPVKLYFEKYVREGATNGNYLYLDAQDLGGMDKTYLRQVSVWVMGRMQEANEVERLSKQMLGVDVSASTIQTLQLGHFMVATGESVTKVYVWPYRVPEEMSIRVAKGEATAEVVKDYLKSLNGSNEIVTPTITETEYILAKEMETETGPEPTPAERFLQMLHSHIRDINRMEKRIAYIEQLVLNTPATSEEEAVALFQVHCRVTVTPVERTFKLTTDEAAGKIMYLAKEGFLNTWRTRGDIEKQLVTAHGWSVLNITIYKAIEKLVDEGYLGMRKTDRVEFKLADFVTFTEAT